jgi:FKBP-type peptidyl-prolyl cis-trans isomerase FkpA
MVIVLLAAACAGSDSPTEPTAASGPRYSQIDLVVGTGAIAATGAVVLVDYSTWLYDSSQPNGRGSQVEAGTSVFRLGAGQVPRAWDQGVVGMREGGWRRLIAPPEFAYGSAGRPVNGTSIPPNATVVFEILLGNADVKF